MKASWPMGFHPSGSFFNLDGLYGGFGQTLHRTRNMTKKDGEIFRDIGRILHRTRNKTKKDGENFGILGGPSIGFGEKLPMDGAFY